MQDLQPQNLLVGRNVLFSRSKNETEEGLIMCPILMKDGIDKPVVSGFIIKLKSGSLIHVSHWRVVALINNGNDTTQVFVKERREMEDKIPDNDHGKYIPATSSEGVDDLPF